MNSAGIACIPSNDFSLYDHVLDTAVMVGAIPQRYQPFFKQDKLKGYFAMARGSIGKNNDSIPALEMTKWFNTNYHYIVPEISRDSAFSLDDSKIINEFQESRSLGITTRPVILGPISFLMLCKSPDNDFNPLSKYQELIPIYSKLLQNLFSAGVEWVQIDEPCLVLDLNSQQELAFQHAYNSLSSLEQRPKILVTSYFEAPSNISAYLSLPVEGLHFDLVSAPNLIEKIKSAQSKKVFSLGLIDGRNVWRTDLTKADKILTEISQYIDAENIQISPSCSLMFVPQDVDIELDLSEEVKESLAFAKQKVQEIAVLTKAINQGINIVKNDFESAKMAIEKRQINFPIQVPIANDNVDSFERKSKYPTRKIIQQSILNLPLFPTTTIGSFPQTKEIRSMRARLDKKEISETQYESYLKDEITSLIDFQEKIGLDVLVHGEFERNDMVQYFAEQLEGFVFTNHGWVQSFGSRYVRPPIIYSHISRKKTMTVPWIRFAQDLTSKPVKGMLTGPVTILKWSFPRNDLPLSETCRQIALAIREEVDDLQKAGIKIIQIDEPAFREGFPLKSVGVEEYLDWAVKCFKITSSVAEDGTQIHTHMCYSDFTSIMPAIAKMDADVISIEAARSSMDLLQSFDTYEYPNSIGPGIYDIHSPRIPTESEILDLLEKALQWIAEEQLWVNPDCGLKTRNWGEVEPALKAMVNATKVLRVSNS